MKQLKLVCLFWIATSFCLNPALACMGVGRAGTSEYPFIEDETALIVWDAVNGVEHFIRQARFRGAASDLAFIVPVPSTPQLAEVPAHILGSVYDVMYRGSLDGELSSDRLGGAGSDAGEVEVIKRQEVAGLDAAVVRSSNPNALKSWLTTNGYAAPKESLDWIRHYVDLEWQFVAFRIKSKALGAELDRAGIASPMVRISFKTPRIFYPYREPDLPSKATRRELSLFVVAATPVVGSFESIRPWTVSHSFSMSPGTLDFDASKKAGKKQTRFAKNSLNEFLNGLFAKTARPSRLFISHFRNNDKQRPPEDLFFDPVLK